MTSSVYVPGESWLYRLDPRVKLWFALLGVLFCIFIPEPGALLGALLLTQVVLLLGRVPLRSVARLWRSLAPVLLIIMVMQPLLLPGPGPDLWRLGPLRITGFGLLTGLRYTLRVAVAAFAALIPILTTPINTLVRGLQKVGLSYSWAMTIGMALRYLETIGDLYTTISQAQEARGWDLSQGGLVKRTRAAVPTLIALIIASLRLSDALALGLAARGFGVNRQRTYRHDIALSSLDWLVLAATTTSFLVGMVILC
jgi:energy-coupling factor transport system permease protein